MAKKMNRRKFGQIIVAGAAGVLTGCVRWPEVPAGAPTGVVPGEQGAESKGVPTAVSTPRQVEQVTSEEILQKYFSNIDVTTLQPNRLQAIEYGKTITPGKITLSEASRPLDGSPNSFMFSFSPNREGILNDARTVPWGPEQETLGFWLHGEGTVMIEARYGDQSVTFTGVIEEGDILNGQYSIGGTTFKYRGPSSFNIARVTKDEDVVPLVDQVTIYMETPKGYQIDFETGQRSDLTTEIIPDQGVYFEKIFETNGLSWNPHHE